MQRCITDTGAPSARPEIGRVHWISTSKLLVSCGRLLKNAFTGEHQLGSGHWVLRLPRDAMAGAETFRLELRCVLLRIAKKDEDEDDDEDDEDDDEDDDDA